MEFDEYLVLRILCDDFDSCPPKILTLIQKIIDKSKSHEIIQYWINKYHCNPPVELNRMFPMLVDNAIDDSIDL